MLSLLLLGLATANGQELLPEIPDSSEEATEQTEEATDQTDEAVDQTENEPKDTDSSKQADTSGDEEKPLES